MTESRTPPTTQLTPRVEITRRDALKLFAAGIVALEAGCLERPGQEIRAAVRNAETSSVPRYFATSMTIDGYATGLLVEATSGRPTKIEGNPAHPMSLGATTAQHQASIADLYDPYRLRSPRAGNMPATWDRLRALLDRMPPTNLWLLLPPESSPTIAALLDRVRERHPATRVVHHAPLDHHNAARGAMLAFGTPVVQQLALDRCELLVALDADVLAGMPNSVRWSRDFARRRRAVEPGERPIRLVVAEPMVTPTGSLADDRLAIRAGDVGALVIALAGALGPLGVATPRLPDDVYTRARDRIRTLGGDRWVRATATALARQPGASAIVVGERQPASVHALAYQISLALGALGKTMTFTDPAVLSPLATNGSGGLADLVSAAHGGQVGALIVIDTNPLYTVRRDLDLAGAMRRIPLTIHATLRVDETSAACGWVVPLSHYLESWGDGRAWDRTASPIQPLIQPLHETRSTIELLAMIAGIRTSDRELVRATWRAAIPDEAAWRAVLANGVMPDTAAPARAVRIASGGQLADELAAVVNASMVARGIEIDLAPSPALLDGRFASNPWLQELPHPLTKQTWGNAAVLARETASQLGVGDGDVLKLRADRRFVEVPVLIAAGHALGCITLELGYGRRIPEQPIGDQVGVDASALAVAGEPIIANVEARATGRTVELARTQLQLDPHEREVAPHVDLAYYRAHPNFTEELRGPLPSLLAKRVDLPDVLQWAMTIDTTICTGCSSCMIACQAENNVPVVGAEGVRRNREMHWLRIDTYVTERPGASPAIVHQPMLCQHCEHAPCEYVCPTFATTHSPDGLNEMTYNRCIGTRFCSNNCPYKVRRFNFFKYDQPSLLNLQHNPDVTVRARGVMEKCSYCVQRIRGAEHVARMEKRAIRAGEVVTACQQACPTEAIQFGALEHADSAMVQWRAKPRVYAVLHELGTRPRTMYLAKIAIPDGVESK